MPKVPEYNAEVQVQGVGGAAFLRAQPSIGEATRSIAAGLDDVSRALEEEAYRRDNTHAKELDAGANSEMTDAGWGQEGFYLKRGGDAVRALPEYEAQLEKIRKKYLDQAGSGRRAQELVSLQLSRRFEAERKRARVYSLGQERVWEETTSIARQKSAHDTAVLAFRDRDKREEEVRVIRGEIVTRGNAAGLAPEVIRQQIEEYESKLYTETVGRALMEDDPTDALRLWEELKPKMRVEDADNLKPSIENAQALQEADQITLRGGGLGERLDRANQISDPEVRRKTVALIRQQHAAEKSIQTESQDRLYSQAVDAVLGGTLREPHQIPSSLRGPQKARLDEMIRARKSGQKVTTDLDYYDELNEQAGARDPSAFIKAPLDKARLSEGDFKKFSDLQRTLERGGTAKVGHVPIGEVNRQINEAQAGLGQTRAQANKDEDVAASRERFDRAVRTQFEALGEKGTTEDLRRIIDQQRAEVVTQEGWFSNTRQRAFEITPETEFEIEDVPDDHAKRIAGALRRAGKSVTPAEIRRLYLEGQQQGIQ